MTEGQFIRWDKTAAAIRVGIPKFQAIPKIHHRWSRIIAKVMFWMDYMQAFTASWPNVYLPDRPIEQQYKPEKLQHEWTHLIDEETFFGLLKFMPKRFNKWLFFFAYATPQILALLALHVFVAYNWWWLAALLFLLPLPSPFRTWAELRGYRRSRELGADVDALVTRFTTVKYWFMWPFKNHIRKLLLKPSPYKDEMDEAWTLV